MWQFRRQTKNRLKVERKDEKSHLVLDPCTKNNGIDLLICFSELITAIFKQHCNIPKKTSSFSKITGVFCTLQHSNSTAIDIQVIFLLSHPVKYNVCDI